MTEKETVIPATTLPILYYRNAKKQGRNFIINCWELNEESLIYKSVIYKNSENLILRKLDHIYEVKPGQCEEIWRYYLINNEVVKERVRANFISDVFENYCLQNGLYLMHRLNDKQYLSCKFLTFITSNLNVFTRCNLMKIYFSSFKTINITFNKTRNFKSFYINIEFNSVKNKNLFLKNFFLNVYDSFPQILEIDTNEDNCEAYCSQWFNIKFGRIPNKFIQTVPINNNINNREENQSIQKIFKFEKLAIIFFDNIEFLQIIKCRIVIKSLTENYIFSYLFYKDNLQQYVINEILLKLKLLCVTGLTFIKFSSEKNCIKRAEDIDIKKFCFNKKNYDLMTNYFDIFSAQDFQNYTDCKGIITDINSNLDFNEISELFKHFIELNFQHLICLRYKSHVLQQPPSSIVFKDLNTKGHIYERNNFKMRKQIKQSLIEAQLWSNISESHCDCNFSENKQLLSLYYDSLPYECEIIQTDFYSINARLKNISLYYWPYSVNDEYEMSRIIFDGGIVFSQPGLYNSENGVGAVVCFDFNNLYPTISELFMFTSDNIVKRHSQLWNSKLNIRKYSYPTFKNGKVGKKKNCPDC